MCWDSIFYDQYSYLQFSYIQEYWCKKLHPKNVCEKVFRQPPLRESLRKGKLKKQEFAITKQKAALLLASDSIGMKIQYACPGFLSNRRQVKLFLLSRTLLSCDHFPVFLRNPLAVGVHFNSDSFSCAIVYLYLSLLWDLEKDFVASKKVDNSCSYIVESKRVGNMLYYFHILPGV